MTLKHVVSLLRGYPRSGSRAPGLILSAEGKSNTRAPSRFATSQKATTRLGVSTSGLGGGALRSLRGTHTGGFYVTPSLATDGSGEDFII